MIFVDTVDVSLRVWRGGEQRRIREGIVVFEASSGFHTDLDVSLDELVETARRATLAAMDGVEGHLSVTHTGSNLPRAGSFEEIVLELVGEPQGAVWSDVLHSTASSIRQHVWGHS